LNYFLLEIYFLKISFKKYDALSCESSLIGTKNNNFYWFPEKFNICRKTFSMMKEITFESVNGFRRNEACEKVFSFETYRCAVWSESWSEIWCFNYREKLFNTNCCTLWTCIQIKHSPLTFNFSPIITFIFLRFQFSFSSVSRSLVVVVESFGLELDYQIFSLLLLVYLFLLLKFVGFTMNMKFLSSETSLLTNWMVVVSHSQNIGYR
jgi:hypothetical protein